MSLNRGLKLLTNRYLILFKATSKIAPNLSDRIDKILARTSISSINRSFSR